MEKKVKEKPKYNMWQNVCYMIGKAWKVRKSVLGLVAATIVIETSINIIQLFMAPSILQKVETAGSIGELLMTIAVWVGGLILFSGMKGYVENNTLFGRIEVRCAILKDIQMKLCRTSFPNLENTDFLQKRDAACAAVSSNSSAAEAIWEVIGLLMVNLLSFIVYLWTMSSLSFILILIILITAIIGYVIKKRLNEWRYQHKKEEEQYNSHLWYCQDHFSSRELAKDIRIFGMKAWLNEIQESVFAAYKGFKNREEKQYLIGNIAGAVLSLLRNGIAYVYLITMALHGEINAAQFLLYFTAIGGFTTWVTGILEQFTTIHRQSVELSIIREFVDYPETFRFEEGVPLKNEKRTYELELKDVTFRYPGAEKDTLSRINLKIRPGEKLAIVGLNGAGKTTLVKLLCGFYDPTEGQVLLEGQNIRKYNRWDYYALFTAVFQQFSLMETTIGENIVQSQNAVDEKRMLESLEKANLKERIERLPERENTHFGRSVYEDGIELSGGETQRLMLARALYKNAPIMILDEPTAALDPIAENDLYQKYNAMTKESTSVFISHRLASTRFCDRILFIADGVIAEEGTHDELMQKNGKYAELFEIQSHYYRKGCEEYGENENA